jgi:hypothetical protein
MTHLLTWSLLLSISIIASFQSMAFADYCEIVSLDVSFLNWRVAGDDFDYAYDLSELGAAPTVFRKRYHNVSADYDPGFRFGLGFDLPCICWDAHLAWTHFDTKNTSHHEVQFRGGVSEQVAIPFYRITGDDLAVGDRVIATGKLNFNWDVVDLEFGKWLCCSDCLLFRPHIGFRALDIREKFHAELDEFSVLASGDSANYQAHIKNEFKGVGLRAGLDTDLELCEGWSVTGRAAASLVWGYTKVRNDFRQRIVEQGVSVASSHENEHYRHSRAFTDLSLGIRYRTCYCCCPFEIEAAWEHHYLFNQHRFFASDTIQSSQSGYNFKKDGNVSLQGLTLTASFDF